MPAVEDLSSDQIILLRKFATIYDKVVAKKKLSEKDMDLLATLDSDDVASGRISWTLARAETEFGVTQLLLRQGMSREGIPIKRGKEANGLGRYTTRQIAAAIYGDEKKEKILALRQTRQQREREDAKERGELLTRDQVREIHNHLTANFRQKLLSLPKIAARCNPQDAPSARRELQAFLDNLLEALRKEVPELLTKHEAQHGVVQDDILG